MSLPKIIQIPCHNILANQNALKFKKGAPLKQFFNINLGIGIIKKLIFLFVFSTYPPVFLLKFCSREVVGCVIKFRIQWVSTQHTFDGPHYPKNKKYLKKCDDDIIITIFQIFLVFGVVIFQVFLVFGVARSIKSMQCGNSLDMESNSASNEISWSKFE